MQPKYDEMGHLINDASMTQQSHAKDTDIAVIMRKLQRGENVAYNTNLQYTDMHFTGLQEAMEKVADAQDLFDTLPAEIRENYQQDFGKFVESIDRGDVDELVS